MTATYGKITSVKLAPVINKLISFGAFQFVVSKDECTPTHEGYAYIPGSGRNNEITTSFFDPNLLLSCEPYGYNLDENEATFLSDLRQTCGKAMPSNFNYYVIHFMVALPLLKLLINRSDSRYDTKKVRSLSIASCSMSLVFLALSLVKVFTCISSAPTVYPAFTPNSSVVLSSSYSLRVMLYEFVFLSGLLSTCILTRSKTEKEIKLAINPNANNTDGLYDGIEGKGGKGGKEKELTSEELMIKKRNEAMIAARNRGRNTVAAVGVERGNDFAVDSSDEDDGGDEGVDDFDGVGDGGGESGFVSEDVSLVKNNESSKAVIYEQTEVQPFDA